jgi:choline kinase/DNA-binding XRE family transcriptional regulator
MLPDPNVETFGQYVRSLREQQNIGQRELARIIGVSAPYLNDIEKDKRGAPRPEMVEAMAEVLGADENRMFDLAGASRNDVAADIADMVRSSPETVALLRAIRDYRPNEEQVRNMRETLMASNTRAIVIAAGLGSRMKEYTESKPKCLLEFGDKTLLQRQIEAYRFCGIEDIALVRGYKKDAIDYDGIVYYDNDEYADNNILNSLFYAEEAINGHVIAAYSDILFESPVVSRLLASKHDISIVVDIDWRGYYVGRRDHPIEEAENVIFDANNNVVEIGKILTGKNDVHGEFIGMVKLTPRGADIFKRHFARAKALYWDKPFQRAMTFQRAYLTDMIQEMVDLGTPIHCVIIERGWKEIDTVEDYEKALRDFEE